MFLDTNLIRRLSTALPQHVWEAQRDYTPTAGETWSVPGVVRFFDNQLVRLECERDRVLAEYIAALHPKAVVELIDRYEAMLRQLDEHRAELDRLRAEKAKLTHA